MTEYVTVIITGRFPKDDVEGLAASYGVGYGPVGGSTELTAEEKLEGLVAMAQSRLAEFLAMPARQAAEIESRSDLIAVTNAIDERINSGLTTEIING